MGTDLRLQYAGACLNLSPSTRHTGQGMAGIQEQGCN